MKKTTLGAWVALAILALAVPCLAWFKAHEVCLGTVLPNNSTQTCKTVNLAGADWVGVQLQCHDNSTVAANVSADLVAFQGGSAYVIPSVGHINGTAFVWVDIPRLHTNWTTEDAWSAIRGVEIPPMALGTVKLTNHVNNTAETINCDVNLLLRGH